MTPTQCREARDLLGWTRTKLASMSDLGEHAISGFERTGVMVPQFRGLTAIQRIAGVRAALEAAGVEFTNADAPGVRLRPLSFG